MKRNRSRAAWSLVSVKLPLADATHSPPYCSDQLPSSSAIRTKGCGAAALMAISCPITLQFQMPVLAVDANHGAVRADRVDRQALPIGEPVDLLDWPGGRGTQIEAHRQVVAL